MKRALMKRAMLLGEGLNGLSDYSMTGGAAKKRKPRKARKTTGSGITGGRKTRKARGITGGRKTRKTASRKGVIPPQLRKWHAHVKAVRAQLPADTPYKMVLMAAKKTY